MHQDGGQQIILISIIVIAHAIILVSAPHAGSWISVDPSVDRTLTLQNTRYLDGTETQGGKSYHRAPSKPNLILVLPDGLR